MQNEHSVSVSQNRRGYLEHCALKWKITPWHRNYLVLVCIRFGEIIVFKVPRSHFFEYLRDTLYNHALEHLEAARPENKCVIQYSSSGKSLITNDLFDDLLLVWTHFRR